MRPAQGSVPVRPVPVRFAQGSVPVRPVPVRPCATRTPPIGLIASLCGFGSGIDKNRIADPVLRLRRPAHGRQLTADGAASGRHVEVHDDLHAMAPRAGTSASMTARSARRHGESNTGTPLDVLVALLRRRDVAVVEEAGEQADVAAERLVARLVEAGVVRREREPGATPARQAGRRCRAFWGRS